MIPLYNTKRLRVAISISPEGHLHTGHLQTIAFGKVLAEKEGLEFHIRYDDIYATVARSAENYLSKKDKWFSGNPHVPVPGASIFEIRRPKAMIESQLNSDKKHLLSLVKPDKIYTLMEVEKEIRDYFTKDFPWLAYMPIYFTEDLAWKFTHIVRGSDWEEGGENYFWTQMHRCLLDSHKKGSYSETITELVNIDGVKISKSNPEHAKYFLNNIDNLEKVWYDTLNKVKESLCY